MNEAAEPVVLCFFDDLLHFFEPLKLLVEYTLIFFLLDLKLLVLDPMLFEGIRNLSRAIDDEGKFVDDEELKILGDWPVTNAAILFPR